MTIYFLISILILFLIFYYHYYQYHKTLAISFLSKVMHFYKKKDSNYIKEFYENFEKYVYYLDKMKKKQYIIFINQVIDDQNLSMKKMDLDKDKFDKFVKFYNNSTSNFVKPEEAWIFDFCYASFSATGNYKKFIIPMINHLKHLNKLENETENNMEGYKKGKDINKLMIISVLHWSLGNFKKQHTILNEVIDQELLNETKKIISNLTKE